MRTQNQEGHISESLHTLPAMALHQLKNVERMWVTIYTCAQSQR